MVGDQASETLATKADLREESFPVKWFAGMMIVQAAAIVALIKLLP